MTRQVKPPRTDRELGIHTSRPVPVEQLTVDSHNQVHAERYEPTPYGVLDDMLLGLGLEHGQYTFIDLGSGKGRVLCAAACYPFKRVVGIEFSKELHEAALDNVERMEPRLKQCPDIRPLLADAVNFKLPKGPLVLFLFNPFLPPVLFRVMAHLELSYRSDPRKIYVLYYMPVHHAVMARVTCLWPCASSQDWMIYETRPDQSP